MRRPSIKVIVLAEFTFPGGKERLQTAEDRMNSLWLGCFDNRVDWPSKEADYARMKDQCIIRVIGSRALGN